MNNTEILDAILFGDEVSLVGLLHRLTPKIPVTIDYLVFGDCDNRVATVLI